MPKIIVYLGAEDARTLEAEGKDPAKWVRDAVKWMVKERPDKQPPGRAESERMAASEPLPSRVESAPPSDVIKTPADAVTALQSLSGKKTFKPDPK